MELIQRYSAVILQNNQTVHWDCDDETQAQFYLLDVIEQADTSIEGYIVDNRTGKKYFFCKKRFNIH